MKTAMQVKMQYVAEQVDGFTTVQAHYVGTEVGRDQQHKARSESNVLDSLRRAKAEELNATQPADGRLYGSYDVETEVVERVDYRPEELERIAKAEESRRAMELREAEKAVRQQVETEQAEKELGKSSDWSWDYDHKAVVTTDVRAHNRYTNRFETVISRKRFPRNAKGTFNWAKIREQLTSIRNHREATDAGRKARKEKTATAKAQLAELRKAWGFSETAVYGERFPVRVDDHGNLVFSAVVTVEQATKLLSTAEAAGLVVQKQQ